MKKLALSAVEGSNAAGGPPPEGSGPQGGTLYWRSLSGDVIAETDLNGNTTNEYVFFAGRRISRIDASGNVFFYYADHLGTTRTITNGTGTTCYDADFTPYGQEMVHTNTCPQNYKFTGYERDSETGLDYAMARFYSPRLGRFMSGDPLSGGVSNPQSLHRYAYSLNNGLKYIDPSGMSAGDALFGCDEFDFFEGDPRTVAQMCSAALMFAMGGDWDARWGGGWGNGWWGGKGSGAGYLGVRFLTGPDDNPPCVDDWGNTRPCGTGDYQPQITVVFPGPSTADKICGVVNLATRYTGVALVAARITSTGAVLGTVATSGITELGVGGAGAVGAIGSNPAGWVIGGLGLFLLGASLTCSATGH